MIGGAQIVERLSAAGAVLADARTIVEERVVTPVTPRWCQARGWSEFLLSIDDRSLYRAERVGFAHDELTLRGAPESLATLARRARRVTLIDEATRPADARPLRRAPERKSAQVAAIVELLSRELPDASRIVDVGAGHGHLTRELADAFGADARGVERDPDRVAVARLLDRGGDDRFVVADAIREGVAPRAGDLLVGLHACGALGDAIVQEAARSGTALALVSCCLQKVGPEGRPALSTAGAAAGLTFSRGVLGLSNLRSRSQGVETPMDDIIAARATRHALRVLLRLRGIELSPGEEARGINRRRMYQGLKSVADRALRQRALPPASPQELEAAMRVGAEEYGRIRRLSLPRSMLGRVIELAVVLDRASHLQQHGAATRVCAAFSPELSPRNLAILAHARLPDARAPRSLGH